MRSLIAALALCFAFPLGAFAERPALVDRIVAVVNKEAITLSELDDQVAAAERQLRRQGTPLPERSALERQVLDRLILLKAQLQLARGTGVRVDEVQLDRAVERIAENNNMTLSAFRSALERDGVAFDKFREEVRDQIILTRLREREVDNKIQVSDGEIDQYLEQNKDASKQRTEFNIAHILVRLPDQASPERIEAARVKAEKARAEALAGADFAKLAASYSDGPDALKGGELGWRSEDRLPELFTAALNGMQPNGISEVLRSPAGFHVLKLLSRRDATGAGGPPVKQTHARQILIRTSGAVSQADAKRKLEGLRERIVRGGADFAELARVHSEDGSAARGGDLGWLYPGDTVPDFERAMDALKPGQISEPIKTPFGWHLIQVIERRTAGISPERLRLQARAALRERKSAEAYQEWLRQLRDETYVDIHLAER
ncbi:MAG TPA: peptidylprolyl isomerase [Burkholderiales bacterium]|nr:peptidylprolyl isomerase [Burkholderiales bacterium]